MTEKCQDKFVSVCIWNWQDLYELTIMGTALFLAKSCFGQNNLLDEGIVRNF